MDGLKAKEFLYRSYCGHVYGIGGFSSVIERDGKTKKKPLALEGLHFPSELMKCIAKTTRSLVKKHPELLSSKHSDKIISMCNFSSKFLLKTNKEYVEKIESKEPTLLPGGEWNHSTEILFVEGFLIFCNERIFWNSQPINVYRYNSDKLTENVLENLQKSKKASSNTWQAGIEKFIKELECTRGDDERAMEELCATLRQDKLNCSWKSIEIAIHAYLGGLHKDKQSFDHWLLYTQLWFLNKYLNFHLSNEKKSIYYPDLILIEKMFQSLQKSITSEHPFHTKYLSLQKKKESLISSLPPLQIIERLPEKTTPEEIFLAEGKELTYYTIYTHYLS